MSKIEKKEFLSNDLIERMIRVEQRVGLTFGKSLKYSETNYFKSLNSNQKQRFISYLKNKDKKHTFLISVLFLSVISISLSSFSLTGNAILGQNINSKISWAVLGIFVALAIFIVGFFVSKKGREERLNRVYSLADKSLKGKK